MLQNSAMFQSMATVCVNLISISYGATAGWPSSAALLLKSEQLTPLSSGALSNDQLSWIGSLMGIGGLIGSILFGWLADRAGRKLTLCLIALPAICSWFLIIVATRAEHLYVSRVLGGLSAGGSFVLVPLFVAEIAEDRVRGRLGSLMMMSANFGILLAFVAGNYLSYQMVPRLFIWLPIIFLLSVLFFPETPFYYMRRNRELKAIKSLEFYRNARSHANRRGLLSFDNEIEKLKTQDLNGDTEIRVELSVHDFTSRAARKAFLIGIFLMFLHECCGCFTMINYTATIFAESGSEIAPNRSAMIVGAIQLIGTIVSTRLVDRAGRRCLLLCSAIGAGCSLLTLGTYTHLYELGWSVQPYSAVAVGSFAAMLFLASCGIIPLPFVVLAEIMPERIRGVGATVCLCFSWALVFAMVKVFPTLVALIGLHGCIYVFAGCCFVGAIFVAVLVPETKGKSYDEILAVLNG